MQVDMTQGKPLGLIIRFIVPIILGNIFQQLYSMVDAIIVGHFVGEQALAAVGATGSIVFLILGFMFGLMAGFTVLTSQRFGAGDLDGMKKSVSNAAILSVMITIIATTVSLLFVKQLLKFMNTPEDIFAMSYQYIVILCFGMWSNVLYNLLASLLRAVGNSKIPLYFLLISAFLNVVLDLFMVIVLKMGVAGAAWATVISQGTSGILCLFYIMKKVPILHPAKEHWRFHINDGKNQIAIGIPMALQFSITAVGTIAVQTVLNLFGSTAVAAYTAAVKLEQLFTQPFGAMGQTMSIYCAQNIGKNDVKRIRQGVSVGTVMSSIYAVVCAIALVSIAPYGISLFVNDGGAEIYSYATTYMNVCSMFFIPLGLIFVYRNALQGMGYGVVPMLGGAVELVSRVAAAMVAAHYMSFVGVCAGNVSAWITASIFLVISYVVIMGKKRKTAAEDGDEEIGVEGKRMVLKKLFSK